MKRIKIDTINYDYPNCGGYEGYYYPDTGKLILTHHSNYSGNITGDKIRFYVSAGLTEREILEIVEDDNYMYYREENASIINKGVIVV